jgi:hypothetical protein
MAGEVSSSGREGIFGGLPLWLIILLIASVILAIGAVIAVLSFSSTRSEQGQVPTLIPTADVPAAVVSTRTPDQTAAETMVAAESVAATKSVPATNTAIADALVQTFTPISQPSFTATLSGTLTPSPTWTPRPTRTPSPTRPPLPTNTRYIPPATATQTPLPATVTPIATSTAAASNTWRGFYFTNMDLSGNPSLTRQDPQINFNWGTGSPASNIPSDHFSVRWVRNVFFQSGTYNFNVFSDDGVRVWLDDQLIIDQWHDSTNVTYTATRTLSQGIHSIRVEYYENIGDAQIRFWWESGTSFPQWRGEYFDNMTLSGSPAMVRNDGEIAFDWGTGSPAPNIPTDNFSVRWTRSLGFNPGDYVFNARSDDGIRAWVDGQLIIDEWHDAGNTTYRAVRSLGSGIHEIKVEYYENLGDARVRFWWEPLVALPYWHAEYFSNMNLSGFPTMTRSDSTVNFNWGLNSPASNIPSDNFSARWERILSFENADYRFRASVDDGVRIYVDGHLVIDAWQQGGLQEVSATVSLSSGHHIVAIEYFEYVENASIRVWWEKLGS